MDAITALCVAVGVGDSMLAAINERLSVAGLSISEEDASMLVGQRAELLAEAERVEFGTPALLAIAEAVASSPCLTPENAADTLARLQRIFYELREELPVDVPDSEIVEALRGCLDELGDTNDVSKTPTDELMAYSADYLLALDAENAAEYRIVDDAGHAYVFDSSEWDYDEMAPGWDGEGWADDWDD